MLIVFAGLIGFVASFLSNISGGGGALIMLPALLAVGVSPLDAIGTIKVGSLGLALGSAAGSKNKGLVRRDYLKPMLIIVTLASLIGPQLALSLSDHTAKLVSSGFIILTALISLASWQLTPERREVSRTSRYIGYGLYFLAVTVLAGFGSGIGLLISYVLMGLLGMSALETTATRRITGFVGVPLQLLLFARGGHIHLALGAALLMGNLIGGYLGLKLAIKRGNLFVKRAMAVTALMLVISLFM